MDIFEVDLRDLPTGFGCGEKCFHGKYVGGEGKNLVKCQPLVSPGERLWARRWETEMNDVTSSRPDLCLLGREEDFLSSGALGRQLLLLPGWLSCCTFSLALLTPAFIPNSNH